VRARDGGHVHHPARWTYPPWPRSLSAPLSARSVFRECHSRACDRPARVRGPLGHGLLAHSAQRQRVRTRPVAAAHRLRSRGRLRNCAARPHGLGLRHGRSRPIAFWFRPVTLERRLNWHALSSRPDLLPWRAGRDWVLHGIRSEQPHVLPARLARMRSGHERAVRLPAKLQGRTGGDQPNVPVTRAARLRHQLPRLLLRSEVLQGCADRPPGGFSCHDPSDRHRHVRLTARMPRARAPMDNGAIGDDDLTRRAGCST